MIPYFETSRGKLYHGDCLDIMPSLPAMDLALTDPPYGIGEARKNNKSRSKIAAAKDYGISAWDDQIPSDDIFDTLLSKTKNQIIFGGNYFCRVLGNSPCWIVWDKRNGASDFADCELAWTSYKTAVRMIKFRWAGMLQEHGGKDKEKRYHPTQKPVSLFYQILNKYAKDATTILDPFGGSGTTALACERLNLKWVLIEREEEYCEIAAKRIKSATAQLDLFEDAS